MNNLHKGHKINISVVKMILQYPHLKHKMPTSVFGWFVQYPNVGHKICMFNEKNDDDKFFLKKKETNCDK